MHLSKVFLETESELELHEFSNSLSGTYVVPIHFWSPKTLYSIAHEPAPKVSGRESLSELPSLTYMYLHVEIHQERLSGDDGKVSLVLKGNLTTTTLLKTSKYKL